MYNVTHVHMHTPYRFLHHVPVIYVDYPAAASLRQIYGTFNQAMLRLVPNLRTYADPLPEAMVEFYTMSQVRPIQMKCVGSTIWLQKPTSIQYVL